MSANLSTYGGGGGNRWITDPRQLPISDVAESNLYLKLLLATQINCTASNAAGFFSAMAGKGAQASVNVANTFVTLASLTGRGYLGNVVVPCYDAGSYTPTLEITVDGGAPVTIAPNTPLATAHRMVLGAITPCGSISNVSAVAGDIILPNAGNDEGFSSATVGNLLGRSGSYITTPEMLLSYNMPILRFEQSLLIRFKTDFLAGTAGNKLGGASYWLTP